jgi:hypothetical protein
MHNASPTPEVIFCFYYIQFIEACFPSWTSLFWLGFKSTLEYLL